MHVHSYQNWLRSLAQIRVRRRRGRCERSQYESVLRHNPELALTSKGETLEDRTLLAAIVDFEDFDGVTTPALPAGWITIGTGSNPWVTVSGTSDTTPNHAFINDIPSVSDNSLVSSSFIAGPNAQVRFRHSYNTEANFDGGVLEISINGSQFEDIIVAGGSFDTGGYNSTLNAGISDNRWLVGVPGQGIPVALLTPRLTCPAWLLPSRYAFVGGWELTAARAPSAGSWIRFNSAALAAAACLCRTCRHSPIPQAA